MKNISIVFSFMIVLGLCLVSVHQNLAQSPKLDLETIKHLLEHEKEKNKLLEKQVELVEKHNTDLIRQRNLLQQKYDALEDEKNSLSFKASFFSNNAMITYVTGTIMCGISIWKLLSIVRC